MYNNIKRITLSGLVACLVVGFSAFTSAEKSTLVNTTYYQVSEGVYSSSEPTSSTCSIMSSNFCTLEWTEGLPNEVTGFTAQELEEEIIPSYGQPDVQGTANRRYN
jgi:hypothetical protein